MARAHLTAVVIAFVLIGLGVASGASVVAIGNANENVTTTRATLAQLAALRDGIAAEAFAEAAYRRDPGPDTWRELDAAMNDVPPLVEQVQPLLERRDAISISNLALLNARYVAQVRADRSDPGTPTDDRVAGPALDAMRTLLDSMIDRRRADVTAATADQQGLIDRLQVLLPGSFLIAFGVLAWALRLSILDQRRLQREAETARRSALTDGLTGISNRAAMMAGLGARLGAGDLPVTLLLIDLDRFKPVNDTYGHLAGDAVLQQVAARLKAAVRSDDLVARLGGDEFAVMLADPDDAVVVAGRILDSFTSEEMVVGGHAIDVGASVGVATSQNTDGTPEDLYRAADRALYDAKRAGRGRVAFAEVR
ncbi:GGDEF domain-containing protein [Nocardioides stalactiti]|uniref:GGDEF domain-containing protein n=1 Tax=Nocardioides stalactiti TaxID=2755356 RepID=UPI0016037C86|nr:GGDEF domain-containing protein [Nocardioides stalactiti]